MEDNFGIDFILCVFLTIILFIWYFFKYHYKTNMTYVKSSYDNHTYYVRNLPDKLNAANLLAYIHKMIDVLIERLEIAYPKNAQVLRMKNKFKHCILEESQHNTNHTSYSVNKGEKLVFCLRSKTEEQTLVDVNTITFVSLHELAHILSVSHGHTEEFWNNFRFVLAHAVKWNLYASVDYKTNVKPYCGTQITDTPLKINDIKKFVSFNDKNLDFSTVPIPKSFQLQKPEEIKTE